MALLIIASAFALAWLLTAGVRRYALSARLMDEPNARSSHTVATPRGGGIAVVATFACFAAGLGLTGAIPDRALLALLGSSLLTAVVGFLDDKNHVSARWRLIAHITAAVWVLWMFQGIPRAPIFGFSVDLGWAGLALVTLFLVWMVNLYNFMDGIDGIAGIEALTVCAGGALCWWLATGTSFWQLPILFAGCVAGFLVWNYPPARIFLGDSGSGFIGMAIGVFSIWSSQDVPRVYWCWFILIGVFMVDATTTLVRRVRRGEKAYEAHRSHAYQYASRKHGSHQRVSLAVGAINLLWLLPLAVLVALGWVDGVAAGIVAYIPLIWLAFRYKAGVRAEQEV